MADPEEAFPTQLLIPTVVGPTAVGKSKIALELALAMDGEVIVADSRQVYRRLEIATNKPSASDRRRVRYHCIDLVDPESRFNVFLYVAAARTAIDEITGRGRIPIIEGGSGLYIDALLDGLTLGGVAPRPDRRAELAQLSLGQLGQLLRSLDANVEVDFKNRVRVERAIEVLEVTGPPLLRTRTRQTPPWGGIRIGLRSPLEVLDLRIAARCVAQIERGLIEETRSALAAGVAADSQALKGTGYADAVRHLRGEIALESLPQAMARSNRQLARRQLTWSRKDTRVRWFDAGADPLPAILKYLDERQNSADRTAPGTDSALPFRRDRPQGAGEEGVRR